MIIRILLVLLICGFNNYSFFSANQDELQIAVAISLLTIAFSIGDSLYYVGALMTLRMVFLMDNILLAWGGSVIGFFGLFSIGLFKTDKYYYFLATISSIATFIFAGNFRVYFKFLKTKKLFIILHKFSLFLGCMGYFIGAALYILKVGAVGNISEDSN